MPDATAQVTPTADSLAPLPEGFADARSTPEQLAQRVFGKHSYRKRYQDSTSHTHYFLPASDAELADGSGVNPAHAKQLLHNMLVFYRLEAWQPGGLFALPAL